MMTHPVSLLMGGSVLGVALWLAYKYGKQTARLAALRRELKKRAEEQAYVQQIHNSVRHLSRRDVYSRLQNVANKLR